jgi:hypothetical protein
VRPDRQASGARLRGRRSALLASRPSGHCEHGGRERGSVYFRVRDGKIVFFDQIGE